jgi:two-component system LytT family sensor kinase
MRDNRLVIGFRLPSTPPPGVPWARPDETVMSELLNLVGLSTGVVLYAMLLAMVLRAARGSRPDPLLVATSLLGLVWNLCALPAYELPKVGVAGSFPPLLAIGFSALGFLPAVVVQSVLRGSHDRIDAWPKRLIAAVAYAVSGVAATLNVAAAWMGGPLPSPAGMRLLTYAFIALMMPLAAATRGQPGARRTLWAAALSIFAVSAMHLSQLHRGDASWPIELLGHHASLPLAFAILYQDFPFALADLFLKRALTLVALVGAAILSVVAVGTIHSPDVPLRDPRDVGVLVTLWVATALLYPAIRRGIAWFVDHVVLDRPNYTELRATIGERVLGQQDIPSMLEDVCDQLAPALSARVVRWRADPAGARVGERHTLTAGMIAAVEIPVNEAPRFAIEIGDMIGGRRLLSDDHLALEAIAVIVGRRIDALRLAHERYDRQLREQEIGKLATEAELRALRAQINPHFLFNALTTIGYLIQTAPSRALATLLQLTSLLRSVLSSEDEWTTLGRELDLVESYLHIERARFEERLRVSIDVPNALRRLRVPPLVLQPLVENAVKHGIGPQRRGGDVMVRARTERRLDGGSALVLVVRDTGAGASPERIRRGREQGVGLANLERRLACQYGSAATIAVDSAPGTGTTVEIRLPLDPTASEDYVVSRSAS